MKILPFFSIIAILVSMNPVSAWAEGIGGAVSGADSEMAAVSREADSEDGLEAMDQNAPNGDALITDDAE